MLKFVGDIGLYLPDQDSIHFTALDGRTAVGCRVRRSALAALGAAAGDTAARLMACFAAHRKLAERVVRCKWNSGRIARGRNAAPVVNVEEGDLYDFFVGLNTAGRRPAGPETSPSWSELMSGITETSAGPVRTHLRVLVVEDNQLAADIIQDILETAGFEVIGPAADVAAGLALVATSDLDGAVLDINLHGADCYPIAAALSERGVPFLFLTGYDDLPVPGEYRTIRRLNKPSDMRNLAEMLASSIKPQSNLAH